MRRNGMNRRVASLRYIKAQLVACMPLHRVDFERADLVLTEPVRFQRLSEAVYMAAIQVTQERLKVLFLVARHHRRPDFVAP